MPNYCMNKLEIRGEAKAVSELLNFVKSENSQFDFNRIIPMPASIKDTERGSLSFASEAVCLYLKDGTITNHLRWMMEKSQVEKEELSEVVDKWEAENKIDKNLGQRIIANREKYDCGDWYEWSINNWGTKWEASEITIEDHLICFETAWSPCSPIVEKLADRFPQLAFIYKYFEPGVCLAGREVYEGGECREVEIFDYDEEGYTVMAEEFGFTAGE